MFSPSQKLITFLKKSEKCYLSAYWDVDGYSIGYGHRLKKGENYRRFLRLKLSNYLKKT